MKVAPDPVLIASEAALWGAIHHQGLLPDTVIVSDDAGQFRVGAHALCWIHAERLVHKLVPANDKQRNAIEIAKRMIWWFYRALKDYKLAPSVKQAQLLRARFDRIFKRASTGYVTLDRLLRRLFRNKDGLLRVLERPEIPINTNSSENDIRAFVTKKKNLRRDRQRQGPRCARHHAGACQNLHEVEIVVLRIHRRPPRHPRAKNPAPRKPHPASPRINPTSGSPGNLLGLRLCRRSSSGSIEAAAGWACPMPLKPRTVKPHNLTRYQVLDRTGGDAATL